MKAFINWSGGKDSALAFHLAIQQGIRIDALVTSVNTSTDRISMHGVRRQLLEQQAASIGLPLHTIELPEMPGTQAYEEAVRAKHRELKAAGFTHGLFGDIFLEDLKQYREKLLAEDDLECLFPLWNMESNNVVKQYLEAGFKAIVVCVNSAQLNKSFCGQLLDESFFNNLPPHVDLCGENGEYHSFVFDGPIFKHPISFQVGEEVYREYRLPKNEAASGGSNVSAAGFHYRDLLPV